MGNNLVLLGFLVVVLLLALRNMIHIVPEYQRLIVFRRGSFQGVAGPGLVILWPPPIQSARAVDLREFVVEIPGQTCMTKDSLPISIDMLVYQKVVEPADAYFKVQNLRQSLMALATETLRSVVGEIPRDDVLVQREQIGDELRERLDETTRRWGVKVTTVEIKELVMLSGVKGAA
jgi:regulator of protease activity HflC (stomatin/prohibitin superfamily)